MRSCIFLFAGAVALVLGGPALAKGPYEVFISGPGLDKAIVIPGYGRPAEVRTLGRLVAETGFFAAAFGQPSVMLAGRPQGDLGPKYVITYRTPGPNGTDTLLQDVYPYASGGPVSYMKPGQPLFGTRRTHGGWFRGSPALRRILHRAGLPAAPPSGGGTGSAAWPLFGLQTGGLAAVALGVLTATGVLVARRRPRRARAGRYSLRDVTEP